MLCPLTANFPIRLPIDNPLLLLCGNFPSVPAVLLLLAGKAAGDGNPDKTALSLGFVDTVKPDNLTTASSDHRGLAPLRRLYRIHIEAASVAATAVISDKAEVLNPGSESGCYVDLSHHNAGRADREGELGGHIGTDGPSLSAMNPLGNVLHDAHAAPPC